MAFVAGEDPTAQRLNSEMQAAIQAIFGVESLYASVLTSETTTSTTYTSLATVGPQLTLTSQGTKALIVFSYQGSNSTASNGGAASVAVSGATTWAASDDYAVGHNVGSTGFGFYASNFVQLTINPGTHTYTMLYRVGGTTGTFARRRMWVFAP